MGILQRYANFFGYFRHGWLHSPKMRVSPCRRLRYLPACKKINFIIHLFITILYFKESCNLIGCRILTWDPKFCQMCWSNFKYQNSFHFRLFSRKTNMTKLFEKSKKTYFRAILDRFYLNFGWTKLSWKKGLCQFFHIRIIYHYAKNQKNLMNHSWETVKPTKQKLVYSINFFVRYSQL